jgi:hypothetical protein
MIHWYIFKKECVAAYLRDSFHLLKPGYLALFHYSGRSAAFHQIDHCDTIYVSLDALPVLHTKRLMLRPPASRELHIYIALAGPSPVFVIYQDWANNNSDFVV